MTVTSNHGWKARERLAALAACFAALGCNDLAGIEPLACSACVDDSTRLVCDGDGEARAESCGGVSDCVRGVCREGACSQELLVGTPCGPNGLGTCNEAHACLGPDLKLSAIRKQTCALADDGKIWCWGFNERGQLGDDTTEHQQTPIAVRHLPKRAVDVSVGYYHVCALLEDGEIYCWGDDRIGQQGSGHPSPDPVARPRHIDVAGVKFKSVHAGAGHTCAVTRDGHVYCWGASFFGQCGVEPSEALFVGPTRIAGLDRVIDLETVKLHTCALREAVPTMLCWGGNVHMDEERVDGLAYQLGPGAGEQSYSAVPIAPDPELAVVEIGMGFESTYAVTLDNRVYAWGYNRRLQLGIQDTSSPVQTPSIVQSDSGMGPLRDVSEVLRSDGSDQCVRTERAFNLGTPYLCWGWNNDGELGLGDARLDELVQFAAPATVIPLSARNLVHGENHGCFVAVEDGRYDVRCFGNAQFVGRGPIAVGTRQTEALPVLWDARNFSPD